MRSFERFVPSIIVALAAEAQAAPLAEPLAAEPAPAAPAQPESGDIVEVMDAPMPDAGPAPSAPPPRQERFELHGWARQSLELGLGSHVYHRDDPRPGALPYDRLIARSQLLTRARYARGGAFEVDLSGFLSYSFLEQGPSTRGTSFNGFNGQSTEGVLEPSLQELFVAFFFDDLDLRLGQQRVAWGRADFFSPNDVVNARDNRDPFMAETELRSVPTLLARADWDMGFGSLQAVFSPFYVPDRGDLAGSNWAGVQPDAPPILRELVGSGFAPAALRIDAPKHDLTAPQAGVRFAWTLAGWDFAHYYHYGYDGPTVELDPGIASQLSSGDLRRVSSDELSVLTDAASAGNAPFTLGFVRRHHVGLDVGTTAGPFALRLDGAYQSQRVFYRQDLPSFVSPSLLGVASVELQTGERDKGVLVECLYVRVLDRPPVPLLSYVPNTFGFATDVRWTIVSPVFAELRAVVGVTPQTLVLEPTLSARFDSLTLSAGGLWLGGESGSLGRYFSRNRELLFKAKYGF